MLSVDLAINKHKKAVIRTRLWRQNNPQKAKSLNQRYYQENKEHIDKRNKEWALANPEKNKENSRKRTHRWRILKKYNTTQEKVEQKFIEQNGICAICSIPFDDTLHRRAQIDHSHNQNRFRGLLCRSCNLGLGHLKDNILLLEKGIEYLKFYA